MRTYRAISAIACVAGTLLVATYAAFNRGEIATWVFVVACVLAANFIIAVVTMFFDKN